MNKSPINALQEFLIKEGHAPNYTFMFDPNNFKCKVTCKNLSTFGLGANKKEAKYDAAMKMLSLLNIPSLETKNKTQNLTIYQTCNEYQANNVNVSSPSPAQMYPEYNYVGLLQEICIKYKLELSLYKVINESGLPHMKSFQIQCSVGSIETTGRAHCKRSAKQVSAKNMLQMLTALNKLPPEAYKVFEDNRPFQNNLQNVTIEKPSINITELELPVKISEVNLSEATGASTEIVKSLATKSIMLPESTESSHIKSDSDNIKEQNPVARSDHMNPSSAALTDNDKKQQTIEDDLRDFNIEISNSSEIKPISSLKELSKKTLATSLKSKIFEDSSEESTKECLGDSHIMFKKRYSHKISDNLKAKISSISRSNNCESNIIQETFESIKKALGVDVKQCNGNNYESRYTVVSLRMLSMPIITHICTDETERKAKTQAMLAIIKTIMEYLE